MPKRKRTTRSSLRQIEPIVKKSKTHTTTSHDSEDDQSGDDTGLTTPVDDTRANDTQANDTQANDTQANDTQANDTQANDTTAISMPTTIGSTEDVPTKSEFSPKSKDAIISQSDTDESDPSTPPANGYCCLLNLPVELRLQIWGYVVAEPRSISPRQIRRRSNMFVHGQHNTFPYLDDYGKADSLRVSTCTPLMITSLTKVSPIIWRDLRTHGIFYKVNCFEFRGIDRAITYIGAIIPTARRSVTNIDISVSCWDMSPHIASARKFSSLKSLFLILCQCSKLRNLRLDIRSDGSHMNKWRVFDEEFAKEHIASLTMDFETCGKVIAALRMTRIQNLSFRFVGDWSGMEYIYDFRGKGGMLKLGLGVCDYQLSSVMKASGMVLKARDWQHGCVLRYVVNRSAWEDLARAIDRHQTTLAETPKIVPDALAQGRMLKELYLRLPLDIWGDGRSCAQRKPGLISSCTRSQTCSTLTVDKPCRPSIFTTDGTLGTAPRWYAQWGGEQNKPKFLRVGSAILDARPGESVETTMFYVHLLEGAREESIECWVSFTEMLGAHEADWIAHIAEFYAQLLDNKHVPRRPLSETPHPLDLAVGHETLTGCKLSPIRTHVQAWADRSPRIDE